MIRQIISVILLSISMPAFSTEKELKDYSIAELEQGWWQCDYVSSQTALGFSDAASCSKIFEELKSRKFNGDYSKMLSWWKENKDAEHKKLSMRK